MDNFISIANHEFDIGDFVCGAPYNLDLRYGVGIVLDVDLWNYNPIQLPPDWAYLLLYFSDITQQVERQWFIESMLRPTVNPMVLEEDFDEQD